MNGRNPWRAALQSLSLIVIFSVAGCSFFGPRARPQNPPTRPSPTGLTNRRTPTPLPPAPTKRLPGVRATDAKELEKTCTRIITALQRNDWATATKQTDNLGALWARFKPTKPGTMSVTEMKNFDARYAKLQRDVRTRNKAGALAAAKACRDTISKMER
ncbi:MAG: DUF4363 family protein [Bacillota bacterium]